MNTDIDNINMIANMATGTSVANMATRTSAANMAIGTSAANMATRTSTTYMDTGWVEAKDEVQHKTFYNKIPNAYFESEIDSSNNVTKLNFKDDINNRINTPNNFLINNYKILLNLKGIFIIKININKLEDYIIKHLKIQMINIEEIKNKDINDLKRKQELINNYNNNDVYNFFNLNKNDLINTSIKIIRLFSIFGFYTIMKENSIQTSPPTSITIIIPKILFENDKDFLNFLFDNYIPFFIPLETSSFVRDSMNIYKKNIINIFNGFNNGFNNASNKEIKITNTINIILNIIMKIFITTVIYSNYNRQNYSNLFIDSYSNFLAELANEFVSIIPDTQCYFNQDNYLEFNPGICTSIKYPQQTCPEKTCPEKTCPQQTCPQQTCPEKTCPQQTCPQQTCPEKTCPQQTCPEKTCPEKTCPEKTCPENNTILYVGIIGGIIVLLIIIAIVISMRGNKLNTNDIDGDN